MKNALLLTGNPLAASGGQRSAIGKRKKRRVADGAVGQ